MLDSPISCGIPSALQPTSDRYIDRAHSRLLLQYAGTGQSSALAIKSCHEVCLPALPALSADIPVLLLQTLALPSLLAVHHESWAQLMHTNVMLLLANKRLRLRLCSQQLRLGQTFRAQVATKNSAAVTHSLSNMASFSHLLCHTPPPQLRDHTH